MKTGVYSALYVVISNIAIWLCFIPFLFLGWKKMRQVGAYCIIGFYWLLNGLVNLPDLNIFSSSTAHYWQEMLVYGYNLAETPLILLAFAFAIAGKSRRQLLLVTAVFIAWEAFLIGWKGYDNSTRMLITGSGLLLILACCITGLLQYVKKMEHTRFENSMVFIYAALLFDYGSFLIIYIFAHIHSTANANGMDSFLLYHISLLISAAVTAMGLWSYGIRKTHRRPMAPLRPNSRYSSSSS
ncbi:MAG TPA: hypothetical protein VNU72_01480 [Puia sp.]|nr:hypothetical protein [Puia sp.]